jgi:hypothetical protein
VANIATTNPALFGDGDADKINVYGLTVGEFNSFVMASSAILHPLPVKEAIYNIGLPAMPWVKVACHWFKEKLRVDAGVSASVSAARSATEAEAKQKFAQLDLRIIELDRDRAALTKLRSAQDRKLTESAEALATVVCENQRLLKKCKDFDDMATKISGTTANLAEIKEQADIVLELAQLHQNSDSQTCVEVKILVELINSAVGS